jgi:hypothetical protein
VAPTEILRIPPNLWVSFPDQSFKVRTLRKKRWKRRHLQIPQELFDKHVSQPLELFLSGGAADMDAEPALTVAHILDRSVNDLGGNPPAFLACATDALSAIENVAEIEKYATVTSPDLHHFVYGTLAPILGPTRGRRGKGKREEFILEAVRRIELFRQRNKSFDLPGKKGLVRELYNWWHDVSTVPARPRMSIDDAEKLIGSVRAAYRVPKEI